MNRPIFAVLAVASAAIFFASDLWAHGGQFRGPGGSVPPNMREPSDPTPPPPPPPSGGPTTPGTPTTPGATPQGPTTPQPAGPATGPATPQGPQTGRKAPSAITFENWVFWYHNNKEDKENLKDALYTTMSSEVPVFDLGGRGSGSNRSDSMHDIRRKVEDVVIPALIKHMDPKVAGHQDIESATYIALAKMAKDPAQIEMIMKGLDKRLKRDQIVQESAALALGLLRRADESEQFTSAELDKVRTFLFGIFEDDEYQARTRGFAALAIGLLGDQPSGSAEYAGASETDAVARSKAAANATTARLFELMKGSYRNQDLYVGLLMAIGMQDSMTVIEDQREALRAAITKGRLFSSEASNLVRSYAALALGRIGNAADIPVLQRALVARRNSDANIQRSAAIGLGVLSRFVQGDDRVQLANGLLEALQKNKFKDASARNFGYISLAYILNEDIKAGKTDVLDQTKVDEFLLSEGEDGRYTFRPFAALSLSLVGREIGDQPNNFAYGEFRQKAVEVLRNGLQSKKMDKRGRAAFACSLGLIGDELSQKPLREIVASRTEDQELRGYAALALGLIGHGPKPVKIAIREALKERRTEEMRQQCATALGLLKDEQAVPLLLEELKNATSQSVKGQVVLALAKIGTEDAVDPLIELLQSDREQDLTRALACAGLGVIGDLESLPSLSRISKDINYRASTDLINEVLSII